MGMILTLLAIVAWIGGFACGVIILIDAFQDAIWKGIVSLLCGLYFLYYMLFEFEHDNKWMIVIGALAGGAVGTGLRLMAR